MQMSDSDQKAWHFCFGQIFHPEYNPERILKECNEKFPGHKITLEQIKKMFDDHQKARK